MYFEFILGSVHLAAIGSKAYRIAAVRTHATETLYRQGYEALPIRTSQQFGLSPFAIVHCRCMPQIPSLQWSKRKQR